MLLLIIRNYSAHVGVKDNSVIVQAAVLVGTANGWRTVHTHVMTYACTSTCCACAVLVCHQCVVYFTPAGYPSLFLVPYVVEACSFLAYCTNQGSEISLSI